MYLEPFKNLRRGFLWKAILQKDPSYIFCRVLTLHKKWIFSLRISSGSVTKFAATSAEEILNEKLHILCSVITPLLHCGHAKKLLLRYAVPSEILLVTKTAKELFLYAAIQWWRDDRQNWLNIIWKMDCIILGSYSSV